MGAPLISGCVGSTVSTSLETAALNSPTDLTAAEANYESDFTTLSALPVPVRSPISSELALASAETTPAIEAVNSITDSSQQAARDTLQTQNTSSPQAAPDTVIQTAVVTPSTASETSGTPASVNPPAATRPAQAAKPAPKKPGGLFAALFGAKPKTASAPQKPIVNARTSKSTGSNANVLPGVKRSSALFGIGEDGNGKTTRTADQGVQVASVGTFGRFTTINGLVLQTEKVQVECFKPELMHILRVVERRYGKKVMVTSGYRSPNRNRRAGGVRNSTHIYCKAADIQVEGVSKWNLAKFLRTVDGRGGVGTYCRTNSVHIDTGSVRDWHHPCRRSKSRVKRKKA